MSPTMTDKSIAEQMREWIKAEKAHPRYKDVPYDMMCRYILEDLRQEWPDKVEALERELERVKYQRDSAYRYIDDLEEMSQ